VRLRDYGDSLLISETPPLLKKALSYTPEICSTLADARSRFLDPPSVQLPGVFAPGRKYPRDREHWEHSPRN
jgi:hypothetical protein